MLTSVMCAYNNGDKYVKIAAELARRGAGEPQKQVRLVGRHTIRVQLQDSFCRKTKTKTKSWKNGNQHALADSKSRTSSFREAGGNPCSHLERHRSSLSTSPLAAKCPCLENRHLRADTEQHEPATQAFLNKCANKRQNKNSPWKVQQHQFW